MDFITCNFYIIVFFLEPPFSPSSASIDAKILQSLSLLLQMIVILSSMTLFYNDWKSKFPILFECFF